MKEFDFETILPREEKIRQTIDLCKEACFRQEKNRLLTGWEFLWSQWGYTRKRWWAFQAGLLLLGCQILPVVADRHYRLRSTGVLGCLFVVFMIPELWRNRENDSIQVEAACLYSLRQIYAARITLFCLVDVALLTVFCMALGNMGFTLTEVVSQLLLPVTVTAWICFCLLCGKGNWSETVTLAACLVWCGLWWLVLMNEQVYARILPPVWVALFCLALTFLLFTVRKAVRTTNQYWEVAYS